MGLKPNDPFLPILPVRDQIQLTMGCINWLHVQVEPVFRHQPPQSFRPLNNVQHAAPKGVKQSGSLDIVLIGEAIQVHMGNRKPSLILVHQGIGWAGHILVVSHPKRTTEGLGKGGFPGSKRTKKEQHIARTQHLGQSRCQRLEVRKTCTGVQKGMFRGVIFLYGHGVSWLSCLIVHTYAANQYHRRAK